MQQNAALKKIKLLFCYVLQKDKATWNAYEILVDVMNNDCWAPQKAQNCLASSL
jgi:hypothetical protein